MRAMPITPRMFGERGRRRAESLGIDPDRLPPGQSPTVKWPVLSVGETPTVAIDQWQLSIDGSVAGALRARLGRLRGESPAPSGTATSTA